MLGELTRVRQLAFGTVICTVETRRPPKTLRDPIRKHMQSPAFSYLLTNGEEAPHFHPIITFSWLPSMERMEPSLLLNPVVPQKDRVDLTLYFIDFILLQGVKTMTINYSGIN